MFGNNTDFGTEQEGGNDRHCYGYVRCYVDVKTERL